MLPHKHPHNGWKWVVMAPINTRPIFHLPINLIYPFIQAALKLLLPRIFCNRGFGKFMVGVCVCVCCFVIVEVWCIVLVVRECYVCAYLPPITTRPHTASSSTHSPVSPLLSHIQQAFYTHILPFRLSIFIFLSRILINILI